MYSLGNWPWIDYADFSVYGGFSHNPAARDEPPFEQCPLLPISPILKGLIHLGTRFSFPIRRY